MSEIQGKPVFGVCSCKEKVQVLSVDQAIDLIQQMAANNWQVPEDYLPKTSVNGIVEQNTKDEVKLWVGTQAQYDALTGDEQNKIFAIISDDPTLSTIEDTLKQYGQSIENINSNINKFIDGKLKPAHSVNSDKIQNVDLSANNAATFGNYVISKKKLLFDGNFSWGTEIGNVALQNFYESNEDLTGRIFEIHFSFSVEGGSTYGTYIVRYKPEEGKRFSIALKNDNAALNDESGVTIRCYDVFLELGDYNKSLQIAPVFTNTLIYCGITTTAPSRSILTLSGTVTKVYEIIE